MKKRINRALICLVLLLLLGPARARAAGDMDWTFDQTTGTLTISGTGVIESEMAKEWEEFATEIQRVILSRGVTGIGPGAFMWSSMAAVEIPDTVTEIGDGAFACCNNLTEITIPAGVTAIGSGPFGFCAELTAIQVESGNTEYVSVDGVLYSADGKTLIQFPGGFADGYSIPKGVTAIGPEAFSGSSFLTEMDIPESVTVIADGAFDGCTALTRITLPDGLTEIAPFTFESCFALSHIRIPEGVTAIGEGAFSNCTGLISVKLPGSVGTIGKNAFYYCSKLDQIELPEGVNVIGEGAFSHCDTLKTASLPNTLTAIGPFAFDGCFGLTEIRIPAGTVSIGEGALGNCKSLTAIAVEEDNPAFVSVDGVLFSRDKTRLIQCPGGFSGAYSIPEGVTVVGPYAFYECRGITGLKLPEGLTTIGESAFNCCGKLPEVILPDGVTEIGDCAFSYCVRLTSVKIPDTVQTIGKYAFSYCVDLPAITLPDGLRTIAEGLFSNCWKLSSAVLPESLLSVGDAAFCDCTGLKRVDIPEAVTYIGEAAFERCTALSAADLPAQAVFLGEGAFEECRSLISIQIPEGITEILPETFSDCHNLRSVTIPKGVTRIGMGAFSRCYMLIDAILPESVTEIDDEAFCDSCLNTVEIPGSVTAIGAFAFASCDKLTGVTVGDGTAYIGDGAFSECSMLDMLVFRGAAPGFGELVFAGISAGIYYPSEAAGWADTIAAESGGDMEWVPYTGKPPRLPGAIRVAGDNRFLTAIAVAEQMKKELDVEKFETVIVASGTNFADALSGSYLAAVKNAPILLSCSEDFAPTLTDKYNGIVQDYISENLTAGGTVYILGGPKAVAPSLDEALQGCVVKRLAGGNRYETNIRILEEAGVAGKEILVCNGEGFADSLSASAAELPILLVNSQYGIFDVQKPFLESCSGAFRIIGGTTAVSREIEAGLGEYGTILRLGGKNRFETSARIAEAFFDTPDAVVLAYGWNFPDGLCGGALAAAMDAPLLLTMKGWEIATAEYAWERNIRTGLVLGTDELIPQSSADTILLP